MEVILLKDIEKVGDKHTIVSVKSGFGRNYLIPQGLALIANSSNRKRLDDLAKREAREEGKKLDVYKAMATTLDGKTLKIAAKAGTSGKIFGSITGVQISLALKEQFDLEVPRKKIVLPDDVKMLGDYKVTLNLHPEVTKEVAFEVVAG